MAYEGLARLRDIGVSRRRLWLASSSALAAAMWAASACAQCVGPDVHGVINCPAGTYAGIDFGAANPSTTLNTPAGVTVTTNGVGLFGNGTLVINADPSDSFTATGNGSLGLAAITNVGDISLTGGNVSSDFAAVAARTNLGDVSINVQSASDGAGGGGIFVANNAVNDTTPGPGNVSITAVSVAGPGFGIFVDGASGNVAVSVGRVSSSGGPGIYVPEIAGAPPSTITINAGDVSASGSLNSNGAVIAVDPNGSIKITSGNTSVSGAQPDWAVIGLASSDVKISSVSATESGGLIANATAGTLDNSVAVVGLSGQGNVTIVSGQAAAIGGTFDNAVVGLASIGSVNIASGNASTTGAGSVGILAVAGTDVQITSGAITTTGGIFNNPGGNVSSAGISLISFPAGGYASDGIFAQSQNGNITVTADNVSALGAGANGIVADAYDNIGLTITGNVSADHIGVELNEALGTGQTTISVASGAIISGGAVAGIDFSGSDGTVNGAPLPGVRGNISLTNAGLITGGTEGLLLGLNNSNTTITNSGTITGGAFGIAVNNFAPFTSAMTIVNTGTISAGVAGVDMTITGAGAPLVIDGAGGTIVSGQFGILAFGDAGDITINAGNVTATAIGVLAESTTGNISLTANNVSAGNNVGLFASSSSTGNVIVISGNLVDTDGFGVVGESTLGTATVTSGNATVSGAGAIDAVAATAGGDATIISGNASASGGFTANLTAHTFGSASPVVGLSTNGNVSITSGAASSTAAQAVGLYAQALNGDVRIESAVVSTTGAGAAGIFAEAGGDIQITSANITTSGGLFNAPGGVTGGSIPSLPFPAGNYSAKGIFALSSDGNVSITSGSITTTGTGAPDIIANAAGSDTIIVNGNLASSQAAAIALASGGASTVTIMASASVSGVIGIDASGVDAGQVVDVNTAGVQGGLNVIDDGTITGTGGTAIRFNPGANSLTLGTGWAINGAIVGGANNSLILNGSIATPSASQTAPSFNDFSNLEVKAGYWTLPTAASYANTVVDPAGALEIGAGLSGNLTDNGEVVFSTPGAVSFGGTFGGGGELVKDGPGVLTFAGTYDFSGATLINAGAIDIANLAANATLDLTGGTLNIGGDATIADITGTGGTVNLTGNATIGTLGGASTVTISSGRTVTVSSGDYAGNLSGAGSLEKTGAGALNLAGNDILGGSVTVGAGTVNVTGNLSAPQLAVDSGATLGGSGDITGCVTVEPGGIFSPGDPVTTSIKGKLTFAKGSFYVAQVTAGGASDLIAVTGPVTIQSGATFVAVPLGKATGYANNTQYTVISATGGVSGAFSNVLSAAPLLSATLIYPHDEVRLKLKRNDNSFASQAVTSNQAAAAAAIEAGGSDSSLYMALVGQTALGLQTGYAALAGESYADVGSVMLEQSDQTRRSLIGRMDAPNPSQGLWVATYGDTGTADAGAAFAHARTALGGSASGVDATFAGWRVGLATGVGYDSLSISARGASTIDSFWTTSAYAAYDSGPFDARFGATYGWHRLDSVRAVDFPGFADANRSLSHVSSSEAFGEVGRTWRSPRGWIEPFASLSINTVGGFALTEAGGASALNVATQDRTVLAARVGVQGETSVFGHLTLHGAIAWRHASGDVVSAAHVSFEGTGEAFNVHGLPIAANAAEITAGLSGKVDQRTTIDLSYHGEAGDHFSDNAVKLKAAWSF